jgi:hypothetical protein
MNRFIFKIASLITTSSVIIFSGSSALAAKNSAAPATPLGNDISWPQCNKTLPKGQAFGIVGVNDYGSTTVNNPYGTCDHSDSVACAYMYGYGKAYDDATIRGVSSPSSYLWWLDVETINSWETNKAANTADLEGMSSYFQSIGAQIGLYSTSSQWNQIAGTVSASSNLYSLKSWIPGARNQADAQSKCSLPPLTAGGQVTLTQFVSKNLDYDYSCI